MNLVANEVHTSIFSTLDVYDDTEQRSAAMNMAIDEALLERAQVPSLRLYRWDHPALSFGYFGRYADVSTYAPERDLVRRWTGGGIVLHGNDLTYSIVIPARDTMFGRSPMSIYEMVHRAIQDALVANGQAAALTTVAAVGACPERSRRNRRDQIDSAVADRRYSTAAGKGHCFANPVRADVLVNGQKVAGAAQRKTRVGLLQQGSIQNVDLAEDFGLHFATELSHEPIAKGLDEAILNRAAEIAAQKYAAPAWLHKR
jgi:lipoate-protein ligase A